VDNIDYFIVIIGIALIIGVIVLLFKNYSDIKIDLSGSNSSDHNSLLDEIQNILKYSDNFFKILKPPTKKN
jgi:hypothetical protein